MSARLTRTERNAALMRRDRDVLGVEGLHDLAVMLENAPDAERQIAELARIESARLGKSQRREQPPLPPPGELPP